MAALDPLMFRQLPLIQKIIADETWLEAERRGCHVASNDPIVRENVCQVILRVGAAMRSALEAERPNVPEKVPPEDHHPHAA